MAQIKVILEKGDTIASVNEALYKAMKVKKTSQAGAIGQNESFNDPAMDAVAEHLQKAHENMFARMINEIMYVLEHG